MALNLEQVEQFLSARKLKYRREKNELTLAFRTQHFRDADGHAGVVVLVRIDEQGRHVEFLVSGLYRIRGCRHPAALFQTLLEITMRTKMIRFELDPRDGEIRCAVECPIEDGTLTRLQFDSILDGLVSAVDLWDPVIRRAMETGAVSLELPRPLMAAMPG